MTPEQRIAELEAALRPFFFPNTTGMPLDDDGKISLRVNAVDLAEVVNLLSTPAAAPTASQHAEELLIDQGFQGVDRSENGGIARTVPAPAGLSDQKLIKNKVANILHFYRHCKNGEEQIESSVESVMTLFAALRSARGEKAPLTRSDIYGAIARGWCSLRNAKKVMDTDLASDCAEEVCKLLGLE